MSVTHDGSTSSVSLLRVALLLLAVLGLAPLTLVFGAYGFVFGLFFLILVLVARAG